MTASTFTTDVSMASTPAPSMRAVNGSSPNGASLNCLTPNRAAHPAARCAPRWRSLLGVGLLAVGLPGIAWSFDISPSARLDLNYAWPDADREPLQRNFDVRRANLGLEGKFNDDWSFELGYDFTHDGRIDRLKDGEYKDVALTYDGWQVADITLGQFKVPFGLEELTSSKNIIPIERSLPIDAFGMSRRLGIGALHKSKHYTFNLMGFGPSIRGHEGTGVGARYTFAPIQTDASLLHLGASIVTAAPDNKVKFNAHPESKPTDVHLISSGSLHDARRVNRVGLEFAGQTGPLTLQSEWMTAQVDRRQHADARFDGYYLEASWMLGGGKRRYEDGRFKSPLLGSRFGTWELLARYSSLDLDDGKVEGGKENNLTLGVNWYIGQYGRIMLNYIDVSSDRRGHSDDPNILLLQTQLFFEL